MSVVERILMFEGIAACDPDRIPVDLEAINDDKFC